MSANIETIYIHEVDRLFLQKMLDSSNINPSLKEKKV